MPEEIALYRVFIATPGGLEGERRVFDRVLNNYSTAEAVHRQALFFPVGWEDTLAGVGRPQELINQDLDRCDFFVLILWDRWGTPPGGDPHYTSGTEEEYRRAMEHVRDPKHSLKQIVVLFKQVDAQRLQDPGTQLQRVLEFRKELETNRNLLFSTFTEVAELEEKLRGQLGAWLRQHEATFTRRVARERARLPEPAATVNRFVAPELVVVPTEPLAPSNEDALNSRQSAGGADG
jgi:hypothetical protein